VLTQLGHGHLVVRPIRVKRGGQAHFMTGASTLSASGCLRLWEVGPGGGGHLPLSAGTGAAVVPGDQPQSLELLKFPQGGPLARAVPGIRRQVYPPGVPVPAPLGDDRQESDLATGNRSITRTGATAFSGRGIHARERDQLLVIEDQDREVTAGAQAEVARSRDRRLSP
jgi:hypothetical protein